MKRLLPLIVALAFSAFGASTAFAGLIQISLVPSVNKIHPGENLFVDINIYGLQSGGIDNLLGAWSIDLQYDSALFVPLLVPPAGFGTSLGDIFAGESIGSVDTSTPGTIGLSLVSLLTVAELDALQRDTSGNLLDAFKLATVGLYAPLSSTFAGSATAITTGNIVLGDAFGNPLADATGAMLPVQHLPISITVPEPATYSLVLAALIGGLASTSRRVKS